VNILLQAAPSDYVKSLIENASASLQEGNVIKANAELLAATVNIKIALATLQGLDTKETTEQLSNAMASLEHGNYSSAMFYLNKANSSLTAMAQSFWAFLELIITIAVLVPVSVLLKK
jgi:Tfp pilus assembly protein PilF